MYIHLVLLSALLVICNGYRILLVFPFPSTSHNNFGGGFVRHLLGAGHELTLITAYPEKYQHPNLHVIDVSSNVNVWSPNTMNIQSMMRKEVDFSSTSYLYFKMLEMANKTVLNPNVQKLLNDPDQRFDAVIPEWMFTEVYSGFAAVFNCPYIWFHPFELNSVILSLIDEPANPSYAASMESKNVPPFNFYQRVQELWTQTKISVFRNWYFFKYEREVYENAFGSSMAKRGWLLPDYEYMKLNASLTLGSSHYSFGRAWSAPQSFVAIGGFHIDTNLKPLPQDLQKLLDNANHGVVYFSMGSNLKSKDLPTEMKKSLLKMLGDLKYTVIWKFEELLENVPSNVHLLKWAPQPSILAHPNCRLFITHGGLLSTTESLHFGKPIIGIPVFTDQFLNVDKAVHNGYAKRVELTYNLAADLKVAIVDILSNPSYASRAQELSSIYHDRPVPPGTELVHWVEHVIRTRGAPHLRSSALIVPWYQKMYLDFAAVLIILSIGSYIAIRSLIVKFLTKNICKEKKYA